jgi:hypothetical protein
LIGIERRNIAVASVMRFAFRSVAAENILRRSNRALPMDIAFARRSFRMWAKIASATAGYVTNLLAASRSAPKPFLQLTFIINTKYMFYEDINPPRRMCNI